MQNLPCIENSFIMQSETVISIWSVYQKLDVVSNTRINRLKWLDLMASWLISPEGQLWSDKLWLSWSEKIKILWN